MGNWDLPDFATLIYTDPGVNLEVREKRPPFKLLSNQDILVKSPWVVLTGSTIIASFIPTDKNFTTHIDNLLIEDMVAKPPMIKTNGVLDWGHEWVTLLTWMKYDKAENKFSKKMSKPFKVLHNGESLDLNYQDRHYGSIRRSLDITEI